MPVTIVGIRVDDVQIKPMPSPDIGHHVEAAKYCLIGSTGKVLAEQHLGGYNNRRFEPSNTTKEALRVFMDSYTKDLQNLIGMLE